ncbi:MAG: class I SAM-dependent methyltransferase [Actinomycetota bacterium]|nr:class I SAM-dependent methyltransferase [Actinomycetota bacterium]
MNKTPPPPPSTTGPLTERANPSPWVLRYATLIRAQGPVLDVACGGGRHTWFFLAQGRPVVAIDRDLSGVADLLAHPGLEAIEADLEDGRPFPLLGRQFAGVVCTNYLHRPLLPALVAAVAPGGALLYETFTAGHERLGRPRRPEFLLRPGELRAAVAGRLRVAAHEEVLLRRPEPALVQRIAAVRDA